MEEGIFLKPNINKHGLETMLDVFDAALENRAYDIAVGLPFDGVLFEDSIFEQSDASFKFFRADNERVAGPPRGEPEQAFDAFGHG